ncbi:MAG: heparinase II/III family protein [Candidatus Azobacteroides sp.]|nr:heparinase II/III family protein [Candidatus Azobacteroides sp.]
MKRMFLFISLLLSGSLCMIFPQPDNPLFSQQLPQPPRLFWFENEEEKVHSLIRSDQLWEDLYTDIIKECDHFLSLPLVAYKKEGIRLTTASAETLQRIFYLSFAYRMTKEKKYLERAETELLTVCGFPDWNPGHFLDVAEITAAVSIGYDWLYRDLQEQSKEIIRESILEKGLLPSFDDKNNWFLRARTNWNQVCNTGMALGAIAIYEENPALYREVLTRTMQTIRLPMEQYAPDGAYPEGYAYWEYGTTYTTLLLSVLEKLYGTDFGLSDMPGFMNSASYYLNMTGNSGKNFNYSDGDESYGTAPAMFWFTKKTGNNSLLWFEKKFLTREYRKNFALHRSLPVIFLWSTETNITELLPPSDLMWTGSGVTPVVLMRTSWLDRNAIYVGFKGGSANTSHAHMDAGSFIMEADGIRWAMDMGKQDYRSLEARNLKIWNSSQESDRWKIFRYNNYVHNTITINNKLHNANGYASLVPYPETTEKMGAEADLSAIFQDALLSCKRQVSIIEREYILVQDEVETFPGEGNTLFRWSMLTPATIHIKGGNLIELTKDGQTLFLKILAGDYPVSVQTWSTQSSNEYDLPNPGTTLVGFECNLPPGKKVHFSVFLIPGNVYSAKRNDTFSDNNMRKIHEMPYSFN